MTIGLHCLPSWSRWLRFSMVGAAGIAVQLSVLTCLVDRAGLPVAVATVLAVEAAIAHNFLWHQAVTWRDRPATNARARLARFVTFNTTGGMVSLVANTLVTTGLAQGGVPLVIANLAAIAAGSVLTFLCSDRLVFRT